MSRQQQRHHPVRASSFPTQAVLLISLVSILFVWKLQGSLTSLRRVPDPIAAPISAGLAPSNASATTGEALGTKPDANTTRNDLRTKPDANAKDTTPNQAQPRAGDVFVPGSLNLTRTQAWARCYVDPVLYEEYLETRAYRTVSENHSLVFFHVPKSGSTLGRTKMDALFPKAQLVMLNGKYNHTKYQHYHKFGFAREPSSRFVSGFQEMIHRWKLQRGPLETPPGPYKDYSDSVKRIRHRTDHDGVIRALETFVSQVYDGYRLANVHLELQSTQLWRKEVPRLFPDVLYDLDDASSVWERLRTERNVTASTEVPQTVYTAKLKLNKTRVSPEAKRKICQLSALDYCCLNFELPPECEGAVACRWRQPNESAEDTLSRVDETLPTKHQPQQQQQQQNQPTSGDSTLALQIEAVSPFPFPFRTNTKEMDDATQNEREGNATGNATPAIAWLMSYPTSSDAGQKVADGVRFLVQSVSKTATATNYARETNGAELRSIYTSDTTRGPYFGQSEYAQTKDYPDLPKSYVLTHTRCGPLCVACDPYKDTISDFLRQCATIEPLENQPESQYSLDRVRKAIRLVDNPMDTVIERFQRYRADILNHSTPEWVESHPDNKTGLHKLCGPFKPKKLKLKRIGASKSNIPCLGEFYRWVQWHNHAHKAVHLLGIPSLVLSKKNYANDTESILRFLNLDAVAPIPNLASTPRPWLTAKPDYHEYFSPDDLVHIKQLIRGVATKATWKDVQHYFDDIPDQIPQPKVNWN